MNNYISARTAAEKWQLSVRRVQQLCKDGLIPGAARLDNAWMIPRDAPRPGSDGTASVSAEAKAVQTAETNANDVDVHMMPLMCSAFAPGSHKEFINAMPDDDRRAIARAEYFYFSGQAADAVKEAEPYLNHRSLALRLSAELICGYANLALGRITAARISLGCIQETSKRVLSGVSAPAEKAVCTFVASAACILLHLPKPEYADAVGGFSLLPEGLREYAFYLQAHEIYLQGDYSRSLGIAETALAFQSVVYPIPAIYLHLVSAMDLMSLQRTEDAKRHFLTAWELACPDDLIEAFGEHHGLLQGLIEICLKKDYPAAYERVIDITYRFSDGWRHIHNPQTHEEVTDDLTTTEFTIAMLANRGWTNKEIAAHMELSPHTVKHYVSAVYQKLGITSRTQLKKYMLR